MIKHRRRAYSAGRGVYTCNRILSTISGIIFISLLCPTVTVKYSGQSLSFHDNFQKISTWCFYCHCLVNMSWPTLGLFLWKAGYKVNKINRYLHWIQKRGLALPYLYSVVTWFTIISKWCMFCGGILRHGNPSIFWTSLRSLYARQKEWKVY